MASNLGQFSARCRFVRAALRSNDRDYRKIAIEHRGSDALQSDAGLSHEFQERRGTGINAVSAERREREQRKSEDLAMHQTFSFFPRYAVCRLIRRWKRCRRWHGVVGPASAGALAALQSDQTPPGCFCNGLSTADDVHLGEDGFPVGLDGAFANK